MDDVLEPLFSGKNMSPEDILRERRRWLLESIEGIGALYDLMDLNGKAPVANSQDPFGIAGAAQGNPAFSLAAERFFDRASQAEDWRAKSASSPLSWAESLLCAFSWRLSLEIQAWGAGIARFGGIGIFEDFSFSVPEIDKKKALPGGRFLLGLSGKTFSFCPADDLLDTFKKADERFFREMAIVFDANLSAAPLNPILRERASSFLAEFLRIAPSRHGRNADEDMGRIAESLLLAGASLNPLSKKAFERASSLALLPQRPALARAVEAQKLQAALPKKPAQDRPKKRL